MTTNERPPATPLPGCTVLPPMVPTEGQERAKREAASPKASKTTSRKDRFAVLNAFTDFTMSELTGAEVRVWVMLFRDTKTTGTARTGQTDLARRAGLSVRMVKYALASLRAKGLLSVVHCGRLNVGPSTYRVHPTGDA